MSAAYITPRCNRSCVFGDITEGCTAPCHRCGGDHATVECTKLRFYSAIARGDGPRDASAEEMPASASLTVTCTAALLQSPAESVPPLEPQQAVPAQLESGSGFATVCTCLCN